MGEAHDPSPSSPWHALDVAAARVALGLAPLDALPDAAIEALVAGADGPRLTRLAGMADASASEISAQLLLVYPAERGREAPVGVLAAELVARSELERVADGAVTDVVPTIRRLYALWVASGYADGILSELAHFEDVYDLAVQGVTASKPIEVLNAFVITCRDAVRQPFPCVEHWSDPRAAHGPDRPERPTR